MSTKAKPHIVLISGKQQSGKSTAADFLSKHFGFTKVSFASKLKEIAKELFPEYLSQPWFKRSTLIKIGQYMRDIDENVWVNQVIKEIRELNGWEGQTLFVIDDWRFPNEYEVLCNWVGKDNVHTIRLFRAKHLRQRYPKYVEEAEFDISETALDTFNEFDDFIVNEDTTKSRLYAHLTATITKWGLIKE